MVIRLVGCGLMAAALCLMAGGRALCSEDALVRQTSYRVPGFEAHSIRPGEQRWVPLVEGDHLARCPRAYATAEVTVTAEGPAAVRLEVGDLVMNRYVSDWVDVDAAVQANLSIDLEEAAGRLPSMLWTVGVRHRGAAVQVGNLRLTCVEELLPEPDVVVGEPRTGATIQKAINGLPDGGVVYIPAGRYELDGKIDIGNGNLSIYGDGIATVLSAEWLDHQAVFQIADCQNVRISRLHLVGPPMHTFRGYNRDGIARPEDVGRAAVISSGIGVFRCENVRVDRCEIERFGHSGLYASESRDVVFDHCFVHENFRYGFGYGLTTGGKSGEACFDDNNIENQRHAVAAAPFTSYVARYNRMVNDAAVLPQWGQNDQALSQFTLQLIDVHPHAGWVGIFGNLVQMRNATLRAGMSLRGDGGAWTRNNGIDGARVGIQFRGDAEDIRVWDNKYGRVAIETASERDDAMPASGAPPRAAWPDYPHRLVAEGSWPGAGEARRPSAVQWVGPEECALVPSD